MKEKSLTAISRDKLAAKVRSWVWLVGRRVLLHACNVCLHSPVVQRSEPLLSACRRAVHHRHPRLAPTVSCAST